MKKKSVAILMMISTLFIFGYITSKKSLKFRSSPLKEEEILDNQHKEIKIALLADTHADYQALEKALNKAKKLGASYFVIIGDLSDYGEEEAFIKQKKIIEKAEVNYCVLPGDHDLIGQKNKEVSLNKSAFFTVFKENICLGHIKEGGVYTIINPYNYTLLDNKYLEQVKTDITTNRPKVIIMAQPVYNPGSNIYMGFYKESVKKQADLIRSYITNLGKNKGVTVIAADTHFFKKYNEGKVDFYTLGALTTKRNISKPNFTLIVIAKSVKVQQINL